MKNYGGTFILKIIHCADIHLDSEMNTNFDAATARKRRHEILDTFVRMVDYGAREGVAAILISGDMFDTGRVSSLARNTVLNTIERNSDILFFVLNGNHDRDNFLSSLTEIPENLFTFQNEWSSYALGDMDRVMIHGIELNSVNSLRSQLEFSPDPSKINIVMLHGEISDSGAGDGAETISLRAFKGKGVDYLALGHIHEHLEGTVDASLKYAYPGCLEGRGFDEPGDHGFMLLEIDEERGILEPSFIPFAFRKLFSVETDITGLYDTPQIAGRIKESLSGVPFSDKDMLRITLTGRFNAEGEKNIEYLNTAFKDTCFLIKIVDRSEDYVDPIKFLHDESLKGEFIRTVMGSSLDEKEKGEIIRCGLLALSEGRVEA